MNRRGIHTAGEREIYSYTEEEKNIPTGEEYFTRGKGEIPTQQERNITLHERERERRAVYRKAEINK